MISFVIKIAEVSIGITSIYASLYSDVKKYVCEEKPEIIVTIESKDIINEQQRSNREAQLEGRFSYKYPGAYLETLALLRKITKRMLDYDTLLFHGSTISVDNEAYLFTAKSGTGKSTHTRLWREMLGDKAIMVNDDKPFLNIGEDGKIHGADRPTKSKGKVLSDAMHHGPDCRPNGL